MKKSSAKLPERHAKRTVLIIGEGFAEVAFIDHLKSLYVVRGNGVAVKVGNARGKGPEHVLDSAIRQSNNIAYDVVAALLDTDIPWTDALRNKAKKTKIQLLPSMPCLEGLLLQILGRPATGASEVLKRRLHPLLSGNPTNKTSYQARYPKALLDERRANIATLDALIGLMQNPD
ncbi:MAG: hypothetical protein NVS3B11_02080 [Collimonas sp.]